MTVRGPEVTIERREDAETMKHPEYVAIPDLGCRRSSAGGVERGWSPETNDLQILGTRGTARPEGCPPVARSGRYRRILRPAGRSAYVYQDYEVRFVRASPRLTDEQYAERTRIDLGPGAFVVEMHRRN